MLFSTGAEVTFVFLKTEATPGRLNYAEDFTGVGEIGKMYDQLWGAVEGIRMLLIPLKDTSDRDICSIRFKKLSYFANFTLCALGPFAPISTSKVTLSPS